jgi:hypothetical protein
MEAAVRAAVTTAVGAAVTTAVEAAVTTAAGAAIAAAGAAIAAAGAAIAAAGAAVTAAGAGGETTSSNVHFRHHRCSLNNNRPATTKDDGPAAGAGVLRHDTVILVVAGHLLGVDQHRGQLAR